MTVAAPRHKVWHRVNPFTYNDENSPWGLRYADRHRYPWIDLDALPSADRSVRNVHGPHIGGFLSGYRDRTGKIAKRTRIDHLSDAALDTLVSRRGPMPYMRDQIVLAGRLGIHVELEMKPSDLWRVGMLVELLHLARANHVRIWIKTLTTTGWQRRMRLASRATSEAGYGKVCLLNHSRIPIHLTAGQGRQIDFCRGRFTVEKVKR